MPILPMFNSCSDGNKSADRKVVTTGMLCFSANVFISFEAPANLTPFPAKITGRVALSNISLRLFKSGESVLSSGIYLLSSEGSIKAP